MPKTTQHNKKISFTDETKEFDGTSEYNALFEDMIVSFLQRRISLKEIKDSIHDLLVLNHFYELLEDLIVKISIPGKKVPILPQGGGSGYMISNECLSPWIMSIYHLFSKMHTEAFSEAFSPETEMYYDGVEEVAELEEFIHLPSSLYFDPQTVFSE